MKLAHSRGLFLMNFFRASSNTCRRSYDTLVENFRLTNTTALGDLAALIIREEAIDPFDIVALSLLGWKTTVVVYKVTSFLCCETRKLLYRREHIL